MIEWRCSHSREQRQSSGWIKTGCIEVTLHANAASFWREEFIPLRHPPLWGFWYVARFCTVIIHWLCRDPGTALSTSRIHRLTASLHFCWLKRDACDCLTMAKSSDHGNSCYRYLLIYVPIHSLPRVTYCVLSMPRPLLFLRVLLRPLLSATNYCYDHCSLYSRN